VNFAVLIGALSYFLYKPALKIIEERREKVAEGVRLADAAEGRLAEAHQKGDEIVGEANKNAEQLVSAAKTRAESRGMEIVKAAESRADARIKDAEKRAQELQRLAIKESEREIVRAAMLTAEKILRERHT
jgi:F-type H+-transporting ATPase subunit b